MTGSHQWWSCSNVRTVAGTTWPDRRGSLVSERPPKDIEVDDLGRSSYGLVVLLLSNQVGESSLTA